MATVLKLMSTQISSTAIDPLDVSTKMSTQSYENLGSLDSPYHIVLAAALRKYGIKDDDGQYELYITHGAEERLVGLDEKALMLFKQLEEEGRRPRFMLRKAVVTATGQNRRGSVG